MLVSISDTSFKFKCSISGINVHLLIVAVSLGQATLSLTWSDKIKKNNTTDVIYLPATWPADYCFNFDHHLTFAPCKWHSTSTHDPTVINSQKGITLGMVKLPGTLFWCYGSCLYDTFCLVSLSIRWFHINLKARNH